MFLQWLSINSTHNMNCHCYGYLLAGNPFILAKLQHMIRLIILKMPLCSLDNRYYCALMYSRLNCTFATHYGWLMAQLDIGNFKLDVWFSILMIDFSLTFSRSFAWWIMFFKVYLCMLVINIVCRTANLQSRFQKTKPLYPDH